jgi:hypothetical protein
MRSTLDSLNRLAQQLTEHPHLAELYYRGLDDFESLEGVDSRTALGKAPGLTTRSFAAAHIMLWFAFTMMRAT